MLTPARKPRPVWATALLTLYVVAALALAVFACAPHLVQPPADALDRQLVWRAAFAIAAATHALIGLGGLAGRSAVRPLAVAVHALVAAAAVGIGVKTAMSNAPPSDWQFEYAAKFAVHAGLAWLWLAGPLGRVVQTPTGAASPTGTRSGSSDQTTR